MQSERMMELQDTEVNSTGGQPYCEKRRRDDEAMNASTLGTTTASKKQRIELQNSHPRGNSIAQENSGSPLEPVVPQQVVNLLESRTGTMFLQSLPRTWLSNILLQRIDGPTPPTGASVRIILPPAAPPVRPVPQKDSKQPSERPSEQSSAQYTEMPVETRQQIAAALADIPNG
jgi:hypothetical protein